jgi:hypothetical protein
MIQTTHAQGHFGSQAMFMRIWHLFWVAAYQREIQEEILNCVPCQRVNVPPVRGSHALPSSRIKFGISSYFTGKISASEFKG